MLDEDEEAFLAAPKREVYSVSRLNREVRSLLEGSFPLLWVEGEISNLAAPASGHLYFSLKDRDAQVRCAMFRNRNMHLRFKPRNGMQILARVRVGLYEGRGEFQLVIEHMEEAGEGALRRAYEELKQRLDAEGLFSPEHKRAAPALPRCIGVITSPTGAAVRDVLHVLRRRFPAIPVIIYPVPVQGDGAAEKIAAGIHLADRRRDCDVLLLTRGGGSLEDLRAFNEEAVARAIHACRLPIVTGVGHEVDFTIADFVADYRAPTPSAAAEFLSPDQNAWLQNIHKLARRLSHATHSRLQQQQQRADWIGGRLQQQHPGLRLGQYKQRLAALQRRLQLAQHNGLRHRQAALERLQARLQQNTPTHVLRQHCARLDHLRVRLRGSVQVRLERDRQRLAATAHALETVSPLATLGRGYAIVRDPAGGNILRDSRRVKSGQRVEAQLAHGVLICRVDETRND